MTLDPVDITDDNINAIIEELRHQHATWESVDRPLDYNDLAVIDINSTVEEKPYVQKVGAQIQVVKDLISPAPGFADQLAGMKKEEEKEFTLNFPADYPNSKVAGKEGHFKVKLYEIKEEKLPELNDEFAGRVSPDFKTVDALRKEVVKGLQLRGEERIRMDFEERVINAAIERSRVDYPPILVELEINRILNEQVRQLRMTGRGMDEYLRSINKTAEQLHEELRPVAAKNVAASLVMNKVAEAEKIEVTETEIENGINNIAKGTAEDKREEFRKLLDTPQTRESMKQSLKTRKTIERLVEIAKTTEEPEKETKAKKNRKEEEK
jgi:trigger factor